MQQQQQQQQQQLNGIACILFDKDGTLINFHAVWGPWAIKIADDLSRILGADVRHGVLHRLGMDPTTLRTGPGLLAEGTMTDIVAALSLLVVERCNCDSSVAESAVKLAVLAAGCEIIDEARFVPGVQATFERLRTAGVRIGVCTADDRAGTEVTLARGGLLAFVDAGLVCGNDPGVRPKPHPDGALVLCARAGAAPARTAIVGDTATDMRLGVSAGFGARVGVLTGVCDREMPVAAGATHILESVADLPELLGLA